MIPLRDDIPSASRPITTYLIVALCTGVFLYMLSLGSAPRVEAFILQYGATPAEVTGRAGGNPVQAYPTVITSMFMHGGWLHLIGNMLYLWIFGDNVEDLMGHVGFAMFYLIAGVAATLTHVFLNAGSTVPMIGASGAIAGVLGAYLVLFPRARILSLVPFGFYSRIAEVPALVFLPIWFLLQFLQGVADIAGAGAGVAWWAHIGGFVAGIILVPIFARRRRGE
jgi:membrane associated rhomboid family serine protease